MRQSFQDVGGNGQHRSFRLMNCLNGIAAGCGYDIVNRDRQPSETTHDHNRTGLDLIVPE
jgi:hypothetical protein